eukprot:scaffold274298_cov17-Tisochrysis_lutea.AAC.2
MQQGRAQTCERLAAAVCECSKAGEKSVSALLRRRKQIIAHSSAIQDELLATTERKCQLGKGIAEGKSTKAQMRYI